MKVIHFISYQINKSADASYLLELIYANVYDILLIRLSLLINVAKNRICQIKYSKELNHIVT